MAEKTLQKRMDAVEDLVHDTEAKFKAENPDGTLIIAAGIPIPGGQQVHASAIGYEEVQFTMILRCLHKSLSGALKHPEMREYVVEAFRRFADSVEANTGEPIASVLS